MEAVYHRYDAVIVGGGGAGLMAAVNLAGQEVAVLSKLYPVRSHTGTAQGGIGAALGNVEEDHWEWHMFDTVKGSDYLADQDATEILAREAVETVYELEHWGLPFSRTPDGKIAQRRFGGHTREFGKAPVHRSCYAADRTGHMILQTLYQQCIKNRVKFFDEYLVLDLLLEGQRTAGVVALSIADGQLHVFHAKAVLLATGGCGRIYQITSNAHALTGDGMALALRAGVPLEDMEFFQFHPTGIYKLGILITEGARGEGGKLFNGRGERFMERYAPTLLDLAPRDIISRAIYRELRQGHGVEGKWYVHLDLRHLGREVIETKLPDITDFVRTYLGIDPITEPIPVQPTAHYAMGGVPTDVSGRVVVDEKNTVLPGLYAAGECACVSVHGANRLGTNSLVDILVFGRRAGRDMGRYVGEAELPPLPAQPEERARALLARLREGPNGDGRAESVAALRDELQREMMDKASVFRTGESLAEVREQVRALQERYQQVRVQDRGWVFNTDLVEAVELGFLLDVAEVTVEAALARQESRGAHYREDFPQRDDVKWLKHSLGRRTASGALELSYKPVTITRFQPQERKY
ncbi:MAG: succinate dehydrogenase flavoprotein subunit [Acidobacteria bacterium]|nr:succinate dehydrogenase flavoprotein subunit [Acidobacteriota bacterium]